MCVKHLAEGFKKDVKGERDEYLEAIVMKILAAPRDEGLEAIAEGISICLSIYLSIIFLEISSLRMFEAAEVV